MSDVTIVATTWLAPGNEGARLGAFREALISWHHNLHLKDGQIHLCVADDGTEQSWYWKLQAMVDGIWHRGHIAFVQQQRRGVGASLNNGLEIAFQHSHIALHAVDDWGLLQPLDLTPWVAMMEDPNYNPGIIRFFPHPDLEGTIKHVPPHGWAVDLDRHHFLFGFRPALWHKRMFDAHGYFKEEVSSFHTEDEFNQRICASYTDIRVRSAVYGPKVYLALPEAWRPIETGSLAGVVPG